MKGHTVAIVVIGLTVFVLVGVVGYLFVQNQNLLKQFSNPTFIISPTPQFEERGANVTKTIPDSQPVIVIESELSLLSSDKDNLYKKVINPFIDYYKEEKGSGELISLKISANTNPSKNMYPYKADAIFDTGVSAGFLISKTNGIIDWWIPECMNGCKFSNSFKAKYPEIVAKSS